MDGNDENAPEEIQRTFVGAFVAFGKDMLEGFRARLDDESTISGRTVSFGKRMLSGFSGYLDTGTYLNAEPYLSRRTSEPEEQSGASEKAGACKFIEKDRRNNFPGRKADIIPQQPRVPVQGRPSTPPRRIQGR